MWLVLVILKYIHHLATITYWHSNTFVVDLEDGRGVVNESKYLIDFYMSNSRRETGYSTRQLSI